MNTTNTSELDKAFNTIVLDEIKQNIPKKNNYRTFAEIQSTDTKWLWYPYIPQGKIVLLTAPPSSGKTFFSLYLCAALSDGRAFMGEDDTKRRKPETVIYQSAEDGIADTLKRRLEYIKPAPKYENIINIDESETSITLSDIDRIEEVLQDKKPVLIIFDPIQAYLGEKVDMHRANEVRPIMARIGALAERYQCTFLFIMHNSKMQQGNAMYAALGSVDIPAVSRSMLMLGKNPENSDQLILCHTKSSLAIKGNSILYHNDNGNLVFDDYSSLSADDVYNSKSSSQNDKKLDIFTEILNDELESRNGAIPLKAIQGLQKQYDISKTMLYRVKKVLHLKTVQCGFNDKSTYWLFPEIDETAFKASLSKSKENLNPYT